MDEGIGFYACAHGQSNSPCPTHFPDLFDFSENPDGTFNRLPKPDAVKPENWVESYIPPGFSECPKCSGNDQAQGHTAEAQTCEFCGGTGYTGTGKIVDAVSAT